MTTKITVDAHAGWDVEVKLDILGTDGEVARVETKVVPKFTKEDLYIHSHLNISAIKELKQ